MAEMIVLPLWQILFVILGAITMGAGLVLAFTRPVPDKVSTITSRSIESPSQHVVPLSQETRQELNRRVAQQRSFSIDEAAGLLSVSPLRVRRWLDNGKLQVIVSGTGPRRVTAVSIHDMLARMLSGKEEEQAPVTPSETEAPPEPGDATESKEKLPVARRHRIPPPRYTYLVEGIDEPFPLLREAVEAAGFKLGSQENCEWRGLPFEVRDKIQRRRIMTVQRDQ